MSYIVKHKNPKVPDTKDGTVWLTDGEGLNWTKEVAEKHALDCEFAAHGIPFEITDASRSGEARVMVGRDRSTKD